MRGKTETRQFLEEAQANIASRREIAFLLQDWTDAYNVGGLFRVADACGAKKVVLTGRTPAPPEPQISVTSLGNHRRVIWEHWSRYDGAIAQMKTEGWTMIAIEVAEGAVPFQEFEYPDKVCFVLGNEAKGVYPNTLKACDAAVFIPMAGKGRSLNVHVAGAIVAFQAVSA